MYFMFFYASSKALVRVFNGWLIPDARHFTNYVTFLAGLLFFYLICIRLMRRLPALAATALFGTQPILFGSSFINQKDIPFMVLFLGVIAMGFAAGNLKRPSLAPTEAAPVGLKERLLDLGRRLRADWRGFGDRKRKAFVLWSLLGILLVLDLFVVGLFHRLGQATLVAAYSGRSPWPLQQLFSAIATDAYKTPIQLYFDRYNAIFPLLRILLTGLVAAAGLVTCTLVFPTLRESLKGDWPRSRYPPLILGSVLMGCAISSRQIGLFAGGLVSLYLLHRGRDKAVEPLILYWTTAVIVAFASWPYLWPDPLRNLIYSFSVIPRFGKYDVLFQGQVYPSNALPWQYFPTLAGLQVTEPGLVLIGLGVVVSLRRISRGETDLVAVGLLAAWAGIPILWLIFHGAPIYNSIRHFLFDLPPMFILAGFGIEALFTLFRRTWSKGLVLALMLAPGIVGIVHLHPYEYGYFNSLTGGVSGAYKVYDIDYWCISVKEAMNYVNQAAGHSDSVRVREQSPNAIPYARADLLSRGLRPLIANSDWVVVCPPTSRQPWDPSGFRLVYQVTRGRAVLTEVWRRTTPP